MKKYKAKRRPRRKKVKQPTLFEQAVAFALVHGIERPIAKIVNKLL